jgi:O-antigen ligase
MGLVLILLLLLLLFFVAPDIICSLALTDTVAFTVAFSYSVSTPATNTLELVDQRPNNAWNKDSDKIKSMRETFGVFCAYKY